MSDTTKEFPGNKDFKSSPLKTSSRRGFLTAVAGLGAVITSGISTSEKPAIQGSGVEVYGYSLEDNHVISNPSQSGKIDKNSIPEGFLNAFPRERLKTYPTDILSEEQLKSLNIKISYGSNNPDPKQRIELLIRKGALLQDSLYKRMAEARDLETTPLYPVAKLNIVLVDTPDLLDPTSPIPSEYRKTYQESVNRQKARGDKHCGGLFNWSWTWKEDPAWDIRNKTTDVILKGIAAKHSEYTIFLAVGGNMRPRIDQSFPDPRKIAGVAKIADALDESQFSNKTSNTYLPISDANRSAGFIARHESEHIDTEVEYKADMGALKPMMDAYRQWIATGDDSGYYLVFRTAEGPVYTKKEDEVLNI